MRYTWNWLVVLALVLGGACPVWAQQASELRLVPFPKQVRVEPGAFHLDGRLVIDAPGEAARLFGPLITLELTRAGFPSPKLRTVDADTNRLRLAMESRGMESRGEEDKAPTLDFRNAATEEDYALDVRPEEIVCTGRGKAGLYYGVQTLLQLIRANRQENGIPCLTIRDWPSLRWRCFQDDMTRGPSSTLDTLQFEVATGAHLKMNLFTYYMEYQYAFKKHPEIGPENGSLEPADLKALVEYAKPRHVDILGNQQSFGHLRQILKHDRYAHLREAPDVICPVVEESYELLDDLYSEVCPLLPFPWFNVCCDETWDLGKGPSKELADEIGVGGVYVRHVRRVHELLKDKYDKRMMMWGDIILQHPDRLDEVPKDTIMLTWGYGAKPSFESQIKPFAESGYEFFVCPGINNWSRILPDFGTTTTNIRNFVRDGTKLGALGMLNTAWEDDGEALNGYKWHGYAWGAECAWTGSTTTPEDFSARIGAVLFGENGDHFGQAIGLLSQTHRLPGMQGMNNRRFWESDLPPSRNPATVTDSAGRLLDIVRPAIEHLEACQKEATVNGELLDYFLFGARRMEFIGQRMLDGLEACRAYTEATGLPAADALPLVEKAEALVVGTRETYDTLGRRFEQLWLAESKPYLLDQTLGRYCDAVKRYDDLSARLGAVKKDLEAGKPAPSPETIGLALPEAFSRRTRPHKTMDRPAASDVPWSDASATHRLGLVVKAGSVDRFELPVEVDLRLPEELASKPVRAFRSMQATQPMEIPAQLDAADKPGHRRLSLMIPKRIPKGSQTTVYVYLGGTTRTEPYPGAVSTEDGPNGMKWIENDKLRLLLGPQGGHVYRWLVKALDNRDLTMPGTNDWAGFSDLGHAHRNTVNTLRCVARGPAVVRYVCSDSAGMEKLISLFAGCSWIEVVLNEPVGHYWDFDNPQNFAADGPAPGEYLFSNGQSGSVGKQADGVPAQVEQKDVFWSVKFNPDRLALGIATPEVAAFHHLGPGAGAGGVGIERSAPVNHFVTYAGLLEAEPDETMNRLKATLDFKTQPEVSVYAIEAK